MADWGDSILLTVEEIRSLGEYATPPAVTGLSYTDSDYEHVLHAGANLHFEIDADSAKAHGHDVNDLVIIQRVPGIDQTSCDSSAEVDRDFLEFAHAGETGIYGPEPALDHEDWVGSGSVGSPNAAGEFVVTGDGALTLTLPCNYGDLLDDAPNQNFPTGMPGLPTLAYQHRADVYRSYDGDNDQQDPPQPYSIPAEAVYCWRGFASLSVPLAGCSGETITMVLTVWRHVSTENHLSDDTRQTESTHAYTAHTLTYTAVATATEAVFELAKAAEENDPDLEQVLHVELSGFPAGNLTIDEPELDVDPTASRIIAKVFEGREYEEGGYSAIVSPTHQYALMDYDESNGGHDTQSELTVRMFSYLEGAVSGEDLTSAYTLAQIAAILHNVCDAWECAIDYTELYDAARENETPANTLTTCWAFDCTYPDCDEIGDDRTEKPLLQQVSTHLNCSIRVGTWTMVRGIVYAVRTDKVIGGAAHGLARSGDNLVRSESDAIKVWQRENGGDAEAWELYESGVDIDAYAMWHTGNLEEYDPSTDLHWEYGISPTNSLGPTVILGYAYLREYIAAAFEPTYGRPQDICQDEHDRVWCVYYDDDGVVSVQGADMGRTQPIWEAAAGQPFGSSTDYERPRITCQPRGILAVAATLTDGVPQMKLSISDDMGETWTLLLGSAADALQYGDIAVGEHDELAVCGWYDDEVLFRLTTKSDYSTDPLVGSTIELVVCEAEVLGGGDVPWSIIERVTRGVWAVLVDGYGLYIIQAYGDGFAEVTSTHIADGLTYFDLAIGEHDELGCAGYDYLTGKIVFRLTTASDWTADPLDGTDTELTVCDASGATAGPYVSLASAGRGAWIVGVDDGNGVQLFYRLRSAPSGFEEIAN